MGRIIQKNNGKTSILTTGENISNITPEVGTYFIGPDLATGDYTILNPEGEVFNLEANYMTGGTYNSTGGTLTISGPNYDISISGFSTGGTGTFEVLNVTYAELYNKIINGLLVAGSWYRLTDYQSFNFLHGHYTAYQYVNNQIIPVDPNFQPLLVHTGDTEVLLLNAISEYELAPIAQSETYAGDIVYYEAFNNMLGTYIDASNGTIMPDTSVVAGLDILWDSVNNYAYFDMPTGYQAYFGNMFYIYAEFNDGLSDYYQDGAFEPLTPNISEPQYSYSETYGLIKRKTSRIQSISGGTRIVMLDLTQDDVTNYITDTLYINFTQPHHPIKGMVTRRIDTFRNIDVPWDFRAIKYRRFLGDYSAVALNTPSMYGLIGDTYNYGGYIGTVTTNGTYQDFYTINNDTALLTINGLGGPMGNWYRGYVDNVVFMENIWNVQANGSFQNITFTNSVQNTNLDGYYYGNVVFNSLYNCIIKGQIGYSVFDSYQQYLHLDCGSLSSCYLGNGTNNTINVSNMYGTVIANTFNDNDIVCSSLQWFRTSNNFRLNTIRCDVNQDLSSGIHVHSNYTCNIFANANQQPRLSYVNGSDILTITLVTA